MGDRQWRQGKVVRQKHQCFAGFGIAELDPPQLFGIGDPRPWTGQHNCLVADQASTAIDRMRVSSSVLDVCLGASDKERRYLSEDIEPFEIYISPIHDVKGAGLGSNQIERVDVVELAVGDVDERGDVAPQVQKRMQLDGGFALAKWRPREYGQAEVDGCRVEGVDGFVQFGKKCLRAVQVAGRCDQSVSQFGIDAPVPHFVGIRKG